MEFDNAARKARICSIGKTIVPQQHNVQNASQNADIISTGVHLRIAIQWRKEAKAVGYGIVAEDGRVQDLMRWPMRERASENQIQHLSEGVKLDLIKAGEEGCSLVNIGVPVKISYSKFEGQNQRMHG